MALVCYLDDSGNKDDSISTLAGYIAPAHNWLDFEVDARKVFDAIELPYLHTVDLHMRRGEFKGWTREQTEEFAEGFYKILDQHAYAGFEFSVLKSTFDAKKSIYSVEDQSSPFGFCLHGIVDRLVKDEGVKVALALPDVDLSFVVERGNKNEGDIRRRFNNIREQDPERFRSISFAPKEETIALQAADFLAYFCRRLRTKDPADKRYKDEVRFFENAKGGNATPSLLGHRLRGLTLGQRKAQPVLRAARKATRQYQSARKPPFFGDPPEGPEWGRLQHQPQGGRAEPEQGQTA